MNWEAIGAIGEVLGAIGVIVTLGYLAIQIRQNTKVTKAATAQQMTDNWVHLNLFMSGHPELSSHVIDFSNLIRRRRLLRSPSGERCSTSGRTTTTSIRKAYWTKFFSSRPCEKSQPMRNIQ